MKLRYIIEAEIDHVSGLFVPKEELEEEVLEALEGADYGSWSVGESEYETADWVITEAGAVP